MIIVAEPGCGKTSLAARSRMFIDQDTIWDSWLAENRITDGFQAIQDEVTVERFRVHAVDKLIEKLLAGHVVLLHDIDLARMLTATIHRYDPEKTGIAGWGIPTIAVRVLFKDDYITRMRRRESLGQKRLPAAWSDQWLADAHKAYVQRLRNEGWPVYHLLPNEFLSQKIDTIVTECRFRAHTNKGGF